MTDFDWGHLQAALKTLPNGEFHLPQAYGADWDQLWIGDKVKVGNQFLRKVRAGDFPGVEDTGRKAGGGRIYNKRTT